MDAKQFAWIYVIENGRGGCEHNYYGGVTYDNTTIERYMSNTKFNQWDFKQIENLDKLMRADIKTVGVDWNKTQAPRSDRVSEFNGTFADPSYKECLKGKLVLNDGFEQSWIADALEVTNVFEMMATASSGETKFRQLFGRTLQKTKPTKRK